MTDEEWLALAGRQGWVVLMKDARIRYNRAERETVKQYRVRCFCLANLNLTGEEMAQRFIANLRRIRDVFAEPGPLIYAVHKYPIERLVIGED